MTVTLNLFQGLTYQFAIRLGEQHFNVSNLKRKV